MKSQNGIGGKENMQDRMHNLKFLLLLSMILVVGVVVAYAALSTTLTITFGNVTQNALTWNVAFTAGTVNGTPGGTSATGRSCGAATVTANSVSVAATTLSKPGDSCTYALTVKNTGGIAASLSSLKPTAPTSTTCGTTQNASSSAGAKLVCGNITYEITTDSAGATPLKTGSTIAASTGSQAVYLVVKYTGSGVNSSAVTQTGAKFTFVYGQK